MIPTITDAATPVIAMKSALESENAGIAVVVKYFSYINCTVVAVPVAVTTESARARVFFVVESCDVHESQVIHSLGGSATLVLNPPPLAVS